MKGFDFVRKLIVDKLLPEITDVVVLKKGQLLITQGQVLDKLYWIESGLLREYHQDGEGEFTASFIPQNNFYLTGFYFGGKIKSMFSVEALEETKLEILDMKFYNQLVSDPKLLLDIFTEISTIKYHHNLNWRMINGRKTFLEKWEYFNQIFPGLYPRIPQKYLASFFNVTPQYISKLKAKKLL